MMSLWFVWIALAQPQGAAAHDPVFVDQGVDPFGITPEGALAKPSFADLDGDGDLDAFIGHGSGDTWFFENTGSATSPTFAAGIDNPFLLSNVISRSAPSFADLDGDGDLDALIGNEDGNIWFFPNTGSATSPEFPARIINPFGLADVGTGANPSFVDIDGDGDLDAFIGAVAGHTRFFENTGSATSPAFAAGVDDPTLTPLPAGNSAPSFADLDRDGDLDAFIGSGQGHTRFFENIGSPTSRAFAPGINNPFGLADVGGVSAPSFADLDGDGDLDAFVANSGGRTRLFEDTRMSPNPNFAGGIANPFGLARVGDGEPGDDPHPWWYSFPSFADIDRDGDPDAYLGSAAHDTHFQENIGSATNPDFLTLGGHGQHVFQSSHLFSTPTFVDIDGDGDLDAFIGNSGGSIRFYGNSGTATNRVFPSGAGLINPFGLASVGSTSFPSFADIDGDGDLDALIGNEVGHTWFFENTGTATSPAFAAGIEQQVGTAADYTFRVTNTGSNADTYDLAGGGLYFDSLSTATTAMLGSTAFEDVTVTAAVPCGATLGVPEALSLSATSQTMGAVMDSDSLEVTPFDPNTGSSGGYFFANSLAVCAASMPAFNWIDISATGTDVVASLDDDNLIGPFPIGFSFTFFGNTYTELYISSNGWISFDGSDPGATANHDNTTLPEAGSPNDLIAVFWDDMDPDDPDPGATHVYHGAGPGGSKVVTFERLPEQGADADGWITTQVVLHPDGNVKIQNLDHGPSIDLAGATVGIENADGTLGLEYHRDGTGGVLFSSPLAVTFGTDDSSLPVRLQSFSIE